MTYQTPITTQPTMAAPQSAQNLRQYLPVAPAITDPIDEGPAKTVKGLSRWFKKRNKTPQPSEALSHMVMRSAKTGAHPPASQAVQPASPQAPIPYAPSQHAPMARAPMAQNTQARDAQARNTQAQQSQTASQQARMGQPDMACPLAARPALSPAHATPGQTAQDKNIQGQIRQPQAPEPQRSMAHSRIGSNPSAEASIAPLKKRAFLKLKALKRSGSKRDAKSGAHAPNAPSLETQSIAAPRNSAPKIKARETQTPRPKPVENKTPETKAPKTKSKGKGKSAPGHDRRQSDRRDKAAGASGKGPSPKGQSNTSFQSIHKYLRLTYLSLFTLIVIFGGWTVLAKIQGAVIASGQIAVDGKPKIVQHLEGGIISGIAVSEGDRVEKDQTVLTLDATILQANMDAAETNYFENQALIGRLTAEQMGEDRVTWSKALRQKRTNPRVGLAMSGQEQLFQARKSAFLGEIDQLNQRIDQFRDEDEGLISEINYTRSELQLVEQELVKMTDLLRQNLVSRSRVTQLERDSTRLRNTVAKLESRRAGVNNAVKEAQIQISQINKLRTEQILTDLRLAQTQADSFSQALTTVSKKSNLIRIAAPVSGTVHAMSISTVGGVIAPGQEIMQIIPDRTSLIIKAQVMPQDMDQVSLGQTTNVVFSAFKQKQAPELYGTVTLMSADSIVDKVTGMPYFEVEVTIDDSELPKLKGQTLMPGMPADIFIQTGERSVFDYLTGPLRDTFKKTMRDG